MVLAFQGHNARWFLLRIFIIHAKGNPDSEEKLKYYANLNLV